MPGGWPDDGQSPQLLGGWYLGDTMAYLVNALLNWDGVSGYTYSMTDHDY